MGKMSRDKGKRGEREAAKLLEELGLGSARRGVQYSGVGGADLVHSIEGVHIEVKRVEALQLYPALKQARADCESQELEAGRLFSAGDTPVCLLHRRSRKPWVFIVEAGDVVDFARAIVEAAGVGNEQ